MDNLQKAINVSVDGRGKENCEESIAKLEEAAIRKRDKRVQKARDEKFRDEMNTLRWNNFVKKVKEHLPKVVYFILGIILCLFLLQ